MRIRCSCLENSFKEHLRATKRVFCQSHLFEWWIQSEICSSEINQFHFRQKSYLCSTFNVLTELSAIQQPNMQHLMKNVLRFLLNMVIRFTYELNVLHCKKIQYSHDKNLTHDVIATQIMKNNEGTDQNHGKVKEYGRGALKKGLQTSTL